MIPRIQCFAGEPWLYWPAAIADIVTAFCYSVAIPYLVARAVAGSALHPQSTKSFSDSGGAWKHIKADVFRGSMFVLLCGVNHGVEAVNTWVPLPHHLVVSKILMSIATVEFVRAMWLRGGLYAVIFRGMKAL